MVFWVRCRAILGSRLNIIHDGKWWECTSSSSFGGRACHASLPRSQIQIGGRKTPTVDTDHGRLLKRDLRGPHILNGCGHRTFNLGVVGSSPTGPTMPAIAFRPFPRGARRPSRPHKPRHALWPLDSRCTNHLSRRSRNQKGNTSPSAVRAISDDPPIRIRPVIPASAGAEDKNPVGSSHYGPPNIAPRFF